MTLPDQAAHALGKLLLALGEDRILWGTDAIWHGSPQDQIEAFRAFEITEAFQSTYGYPALTPEVKAKIFGLNAAGLYGVDPDAVRCTLASDLTRSWRRESAAMRGWGPVNFGPRTRRQFLRIRDGEPH